MEFIDRLDELIKEYKELSAIVDNLSYMKQYRSCHSVAFTHANPFSNTETLDIDAQEDAEFIDEMLGHALKYHVEKLNANAMLLDMANAALERTFSGEQTNKDFWRDN